jgi:diacylglycerol kinase
MKGLKKFLMGFFYAGRGIISGFKERNMKFHGAATIAVIFLGIIFKLSQNEWLWILTVIGLVWSAELANTSIEDLANIVKDYEGLDYRATARTRDLAAGSVLVIAIIAAIVGLIIFVPKFFGY